MTSAALPLVARLRARAPAVLEPRAVPVWRLTLAMYAIALLLGLRLGFGYDGADLNLVAGCGAFALVSAGLLRRRGQARAAAGLEAAVLMLAASVATAVLSALFATSALPLRDAALARADAVLFGGGWPAVHAWLLPRPGLSWLLATAYGTLSWQPFLLIGALAATGRLERLWQLARGWVVALAACVATFPFVPALGPFVHFGHGLGRDPLLTAVSPGWRAPQLLLALRDGSFATIDANRLTGLVAFPSFHTAGAILLMWGWCALPRALAAPFVAVNLLMIAATPTVGSHYLVDTLAGAVLASGVIAWARRTQ